MVAPYDPTDSRPLRWAEPRPGNPGGGEWLEFDGHNQLQWMRRARSSSAFRDAGGSGKAELDERLRVWTMAGAFLGNDMVRITDWSKERATLDALLDEMERAGGQRRGDADRLDEAERELTKRNRYLNQLVEPMINDAEAFSQRTTIEALQYLRSPEEAAQVLRIWERTKEIGTLG